MGPDRDLIELLARDAQDGAREYVMHLHGSAYALHAVSIARSATPVSEPTTRGGAYFEDRFAYRMRAVVRDTSVVPLLTGQMLGPNTEFGLLRITARARRASSSSSSSSSHDDDAAAAASTAPPPDIEVIANLTDSVQTPDSVELGMTIVGAGGGDPSGP